MLRIHFILFCFLLFCSCTKEKAADAGTVPNNNETVNKWLSDLSFEKVTLTNIAVGYTDIVFNNGNAAILDTRNTVSFSNNNGTTWTEKLTLSGATIKCIALKPDGSSLFIGGLSLANYTFGAKFWVYTLPASGNAVLNYQGEAKVSNTNNPILADFMRASWNGDGSVYASFGRSNYRDGFFGNIVPDGRVIFTRRTPSSSRVNGNPPTGFPTHCQGFSINDARRTLYLSAYEFVPSANMNLMAPYVSRDGNKGSGDSWFSIANGWKPGLVQHMAENKKGDYMVAIGDGDRFFINSELFTERFVQTTPKGISGKMMCTAIDNNNYIWIGTENGLFKSSKPLPALYDPFG